MEPVLPMTLRGDNLGQRHRYFNLRVNQYVSDQASFEDIEAVPEQSALDRLFKIDLANKFKNVDYILNTLKDDDMLYVSKALKCKWLLERRDIINPKYLEEELFPEMVLPAISKMKHWLYINLCDPVSCQEFYIYYKVAKFDFAIKFLIRCDNEFVLKEFPESLVKITPHYLKIFGQKNPIFIKLYFNALETNSELVKRYLENETSFYHSIKCVLKPDPDLYLDIVEKYHNLKRFTKFSPSATDNVLRLRKNRIMAKSELYMAHLLHIKTVAWRFSDEECEEMVLRLARAVYLNNWFSYTNVEPLVKRVPKETRSAFKKQVFVDKDVGKKVIDCPYKFPSAPLSTEIDCDKLHVFHDELSHNPIMMEEEYNFRFHSRRRFQRKRLGYRSARRNPVSKSELQKLFNEFRFMDFELTLQILKDRVSATSSADMRRDMLLVLVSKSGGRVENLRDFLEFALRLRNEPVHLRAAVVRSLVNRAYVWRMPEDAWGTMLEYGVGLGLDGNEAEAECNEGLHAVALRQLLASGDCDAKIRTALFDDFSALSQYKLTISERAIVSTSLIKILETAARNANPKDTKRYLGCLLDVLIDYRINIKTSPVVSAIADFAKREPLLARSLLQRLYKARVGRRQLLRQYLKFRHDDAALVNVLRHDLEAMELDWFIKLLKDGETHANQFLLKLALYFNEPGGAAEKIRAELKNIMLRNIDTLETTRYSDLRLARPLAILTSGEVLQSILFSSNIASDKQKKLSAALRANLHRSRPAPDALVLGWQKAGLKAVAVRVMRCRPNQVTQIVQRLLNEGTKRTVRLALALMHRTSCVVDIVTTAVDIRPLATLRAALFYFRNNGDAADLRIWNLVKPFLVNVDVTYRKGLYHILAKVAWVPKPLKANYLTILYLALDKTYDRNARYVLYDLTKYLHEVSDDLLHMLLLRMLKKVDKESPESYPAIVIRYLMLSKSMEEQRTRFQEIGAPFLKKIYTFRDNEDPLRRRFFTDNFNEITRSLLFNFAFFDTKYQSCLTVIERVLEWMKTFLPKNTYFKQYAHVHATMLYLKAVRQSIKENPDIFADVSRKLSDGVDVVGFAFGTLIVMEAAELKSQYFESVVELYGNAFTEYLNEYFGYTRSKSKFVAAVIKGILAENVGCETRLGVHVLRENRYNLEVVNAFKEIKQLLEKKEDLAGKFFFNAYINE